MPKWPSNQFSGPGIPYPCVLHAVSRGDLRAIIAEFQITDDRSVRQRFSNLCRRLHLNQDETDLDVAQFKKPILKGGQYDLLAALGPVN